MDLHPGPARRPIGTAKGLAGVPDQMPCPRSTDGQKVPTLMRRCQPGKSLAQSLKTKRYFNWVRPHPSRPSPTLPKSVSLAGFCTIWHPTENRSLTGREAARLQSFPDQFQFVGYYQTQWQRIGNSVPPLLMAAVGRHLTD